MLSSTIPSSPNSPPYQSASPLLLQGLPAKRKRLINGIPNFVIPSPYTTKNKILISFSMIGIVIIAITLASVLALVLNQEIKFGGMRLYVYFFIIDGVIVGYVALMFIVTAIMRIASKFSRRFRYYISPFSVPLYTCIWAILCFEFLPIIVPEIKSNNEAARLLREVIRIAASCSIVSAAGTILLLFIERVVYGDLQERLWNVMWSERCISAVALEDHSHVLHTITINSTPENVLSLSAMIREGVEGLHKWLGLDDPDPKDDQAMHKISTNITNMIMVRRDRTNRGLLYPIDLSNIPDLRSKDANNLFQIFDSDQQGEVSAENIKSAIEILLIEKKSVVSECTSRSLIVGIGHQMIRTLVTTFIIVIILVVFLEVDIYTLLVGLGTSFIGLGFALSSSLQGLLASLQMIFFVRPFEIGDMVRINEGQPLQVEKVGIASTFFYSLDGYGVFYPNAELAKSRIDNWKRSRDVTFDIPLYLNVDTKMDQLDYIKREIQEFLDKNSQHSPRMLVLVNETNKQFLSLIIKVTLKTIWQERYIWMKFSSELRIFATDLIVKLNLQYQKTEILKNSNFDPLFPPRPSESHLG